MTSCTQVPLGEICTINPRTIRGEHADDILVSFVPMSALDERLGVIKCTDQRPLAEVSKGYTSFRNGDVLFAKITPCMENGKAAVAQGLANGIGRGSTEFYVLRPGERVLAEYIYWFVRQARFREEAKRSFNGTGGQQRVPKSFMESVSIPLPSLVVQRRIVGVLNRAARIEQLRTQADKRLREFIRALFVEMFGDPATNPMGWEVQRLGDLATLGPQYGANACSAALLKDQPRYVRITDIQEGGGLSNEPVGINAPDWEPYRLVDGDLLFARSGATVGKTYIHRGENGLCVFAGYLIRFRLDPNRLHPHVAFAFTQTSYFSDWVRSKRRTAAQPNINGREYASLELPVPDLRLQTQFVHILNQAAAVQQLGKQATNDAAALAASLLDRLLDDAEE